MARMRLQRFLSQAGVAARRKAEGLITEGAVQVNGEVVTELGTRVDPARDVVAVGGEVVQQEELHYLVLNKPKGCVTAMSDPKGRKTVMDYLPGLPAAVKPVGRLDYHSEGVLLLTNDGDLSAALQSPRTHAEKTYHVKLKGKIAQRDLDAMRRGVRLDDGAVTRPAQVDKLGKTGSKHEWLVMTLIEGKSRQIRRMASALGYDVIKIQRVAFAGIDFHGLRVGDARELTQAEVNMLRRVAGLGKEPGAAARGKWSARREDTELARRAKDRARRRAEGEPEPTRGGGRDTRGGGRDTRGGGRDTRGGGRDTRGGGRDTRGGGRDTRGGGRDTRGGGRDTRGGGRDTRGGGRDTRGGGRDTRGGGRARSGRDRAKPAARPRSGPRRGR